MAKYVIRTCRNQSRNEPGEAGPDLPASAEALASAGGGVKDDRRRIYPTISLAFIFVRKYILITGRVVMGYEIFGKKIRPSLLDLITYVLELHFESFEDFVDHQENYSQYKWCWTNDHKN